MHSNKQAFCVLGNHEFSSFGTEIMNLPKSCRQHQELNTLLETVVFDVSKLLNAEATVMMMVDHENDELYTKASEKIPEFRSDIGRGIMGNAVKFGRCFL